MKFLIVEKVSGKAKSYNSYEDVIKALLKKYGAKNEFLKEVLENDPGGELVDDDIEALNNIVDIYINDEINHNDPEKEIEISVK